MIKSIEALSRLFTPDDLIFGAKMIDGKPIENFFGHLQPRIQNSEFYSINPLKVVDYDGSPRKGINVATFRNFMFESDAGTLDFQLTAWKTVAEQLPVAMLTYSGGKSYHAIVSLMDTPPWAPHTERGVMDYRRAWKGLARKIMQLAPELELDMATKDPSRLSRTPFALRSTTATVQDALLEAPFNRFITTEEVMVLESALAPETPPQAHQIFDIKSMDQFKAVLDRPEHVILKHKLYVAPQSWASAQSMYPELFRYTCWAIDATNVPRDIFIEYLRKYTFPVILGKGYPRDLAIPVRNAYEYKQP